MSTRPTIKCGCPHCTAYGPRKPPGSFEQRVKARAEIEAWAKTAEGQAALAELRQSMLMDQGKRQLGQALQELFE